MSWTGPVAAVVIAASNPNHTRVADLTSTSTVVVPDAGGEPHLLMMGVSPMTLKRATGTNWSSPTKIPECDGEITSKDPRVFSLRSGASGPDKYRFVVDLPKGEVPTSPATHEVSGTNPYSQTIEAEPVTENPFREGEKAGQPSNEGSEPSGPSSNRRQRPGDSTSEAKGGGGLLRRDAAGRRADPPEEQSPANPGARNPPPGEDDGPRNPPPGGGNTPPPPGGAGPQGEGGRPQDPGPSASVLDDAMPLSCIISAREGVTAEIKRRLIYGQSPVDQGSKFKMNMHYSDFHIIRLPDQSYFAVAVRRAARTEDLEGKTGPNTLRPESSLADIVGWWSPNAEFSGKDVRGPLQIVDSFNGRPNQEVRYWLGVPGVGVSTDAAGQSLFVYYATEAPTKPYIDSPNGYKVDGFEPGVSVRRVPYDGFADALALVRPGFSLGKLNPFRGDPTDESEWTTDTVIEGEPLGMIRVWAATGTLDKTNKIAPVMPLDSYYKDSATFTADPQPASCDGELKLYFTRLAAGAKSLCFGASCGQGIWVASALPDGIKLLDKSSGKTIEAEHGRDFVVAEPMSGKSTSHLVPAGSERAEHGERIFIDPDPVQLPSGQWYVYAGSDDGHGLWRFEGTKKDGCTKWHDLW